MTKVWNKIIKSSNILFYKKKSILIAEMNLKFIFSKCKPILTKKKEEKTLLLRISSFLSNSEHTFFKFE